MARSVKLAAPEEPVVAGSAAPLVARAEGCVVIESWDAAPAPSVTSLDTAAVSPVALKRSVYVPAGPVIARSVKLAAPDALVVAVRVPPRVAPEGPEAIAAVTTMPDCG